MSNDIITTNANISMLGPIKTKRFGQPLSPLAYPGGKSRAREIIVPILKRGAEFMGTNKILSPFVGGGNIELTMEAEGFEVTHRTHSRLSFASGNTRSRIMKR